MAGSACSPIDYASMMLVVLFIVPYHKFFCAPVRGLWHAATWNENQAKELSPDTLSTQAHFIVLCFY